MQANNTITPGLVSVTFRHLSATEIIALAVRAGIKAIEWGGDVHCPPQHLDLAEKLGQQTRDAGLSVDCYGSYYRCIPNQYFGEVLETAVALGAPMIRVWAGAVGSADVSEAQRAIVTECARRAVSEAKKKRIKVAFEWHKGTLTDTTASALTLLRAIPNARTLWQPSEFEEEEVRLHGLKAILDRLESMHVYHWVPKGAALERRPLAEGADVWTRRLKILQSVNGVARGALLEFVQNNQPEQLLADAATLHEWLRTAHTPTTPNP